MKTTVTTTYDIGGCWGDAINWMTPGETVVGWKPRRPEKDDLLRCKMQSGRTGLYEFTAVVYMRDPQDMFFGDVTFKQYEDEPNA